jgi:hypothetical protein
MKPPNEREAAPEIIDALAELLGTPSSAIRLRAAAADQSYDYFAIAPNHSFVVEYKSLATPGPLADSVQRLKRAAGRYSVGTIPLLVAPFLSPRCRELCHQSGVCWLDFSGNAKIVASGLRIWIEGRPNKFVQPGRPSSAFAPKSSRVTRQLLIEPHRFQTQAELARQTKLGDGFVSKIVSRLDKEHYLITNEAGAVRPRDPNVLLDAWLETYDFNSNRILAGQVPANSGEEGLHITTGQLSHAIIDYAVTGLSAAWLYTKFAEFRLTTIYVHSMPSRALLKKIDFAERPEGGNLWFVVARDESVFHGSQQLAGVQCASPLQTFLDLKGHPERAKEAASELSKKLLTWRRRGK